MLDILARFDILGLSTLLGSLLFLGGLLWVLWDNRSFDALNRRHDARQEPTLRPSAPTRTASPDRPAKPEDVDGGRDDGPVRPRRPRRAA